VRARNDRGAALIDVIFTAGLIALVSSIAIPVLHASRPYDQARSAGRFLAARLQQARTEALRRNASVAIRFDPDDTDRFSVYADGDGDGVLESDIARGVDRLICAEARFSDYADGIAFRLNQDVLEPETGIALAAGADPLRIGRSTFVSFSPLGSATSGTLYLAATAGPQMAVRIFGATSRVRLLRYERTTRQWREE
jgi:Tfp pilus assembly protein FimT